MKSLFPISISPCLVLIVLLTLFAQNVSAQDPQFSQFYANSLMLNPGFTGNTTQLRIATSYRNQWSSLPKAFVSYTAAVDYNFEKANSGLGMIFVKDKSGTSGLSYSNFGFSYAHYFQLSRKLALRPGIRASYGQFSVNQSEFTFADQIVRDDASSSIENIGNSIGYFDFSSGVVLAHLEKYWLGVSIDHINKPNYSFLKTEETIPIKMSVHGGWNFEINNTSRYQNGTNVRVMAHYKAQGLWDQLDIGTYFEKEPLIFGFWYRGLPGLKKSDFSLPNQDAIILLLGLKTKDFKIGYSYDITISRLSGNSGGSHEVSIIYEVASKRKKRRRRKFLVPCAKF